MIDTANLSIIYSRVYGFERDFGISSHKRWLDTHWYAALPLGGVYVVCVHVGQWLMRERRPVPLRAPLLVWNVLLAVFSIAGTLRSYPEFRYALSVGWHYSCCLKQTFAEHNPVTALWSYLFTTSKVLELFDTLFIVLRKQPLIFLHWYHHVTVLIFTWYSYPDFISTARWFVMMNYSVHSFMYTYYAFRVLRFRIPSWIAMMLTTFQISQMVVGCMVNFWAYYVLSSGGECHVPMSNIKISLLMYFTYFLLFVKFFTTTYILRKKKPTTNVVYKVNGKKVD